MEPIVTTEKGHQAETSYEEASLLQRIAKYKAHYLIVIPALVIILVLKVIPFFYTLYMSLSHFNIFSGPEFAGVVNFKELFQNPDFMDSFVYTLLYKLGYLAVAGLVAFGAALALSRVRSRKWRSWLTTGLLLPYVLPSVLVGYFALLIFFPGESAPLGPGGDVPRNVMASRLVVLLMEVLKTCGIPIMIALAAIAAKHAAVQKESGHIGHSGFWTMNARPALRAIAALTLLQLAAVGTIDLELVRGIANSLYTDTPYRTIEHFIFETGFLHMRMGIASAAWVIQFLIQLVLAVAAYFLVRKSFMRDLFPVKASTRSNLATGSRSAGTIATAATLAYVGVVLFYVFINPFLHTAEPQADEANAVGLSAINVIQFLGIFGMNTIISMVMVVTLAYPLTVKRLPGGMIYRLFLIVIMSMGAAMIPEYFLMSKLSLMDTWVPSLLTGLVSIVPVFIVKSMFNRNHSHLKEQAEREGKGELHTFITIFIPKVWKPMLVLGVLHFIMLWGTTVPFFIYTIDPVDQSPVTRFMILSRLYAETTDPSVLQTGAILSLLPVALLILCRRWFTPEVLIYGLLKR